MTEQTSLELQPACLDDGSIKPSTQPTLPQAKGWPTIQQGDHTLILAPTGLGKTLAAFPVGHRQPVPRTHRRRCRDRRRPTALYFAAQGAQQRRAPQLAYAPRGHPTGRQPTGYALPRHPRCRSIWRYALAGSAGHVAHAAAHSHHHARIALPHAHQPTRPRYVS